MKSILLATMLSLGSALAHAAAITLTAEVDSVAHVYSSGYGYDQLVGSLPGATPAPSTSGRPSDYDSVLFRLDAPDGYRFTVDPWTGASSIGLNIGLYYNYAGGSSALDVLPITVTFEDLVGPGPTSNTLYGRAFADGTQFMIEGWLMWSGWGAVEPEISFTSLLIEADLSGVGHASSAMTAFVPNESTSVTIRSFMPRSAPAADGGNTLRVVLDPSGPGGGTVPEPGTAWLVSLGVLGLLMATQRGLRTRATGPTKTRRSR